MGMATKSDIVPKPGKIKLKPMNIQKLFKPYIVKRKNGQCQVLIPLIELDELCDRIELFYNSTENATVERLKGYRKGLEEGIVRENNRILNVLDKHEAPINSYREISDFLKNELFPKIYRKKMGKITESFKELADACGPDAWSKCTCLDKDENPYADKCEVCQFEEKIADTRGER